ncbi:hypothetical protein Afil01_33640 [Actinorhabdospora filicis]|uniref:Uncharacterized protein n=1 Tax=Actinorhabdospora filicis TaxID=1785913 RepID=A0A9W6SML7_9ACTN|nr:hypothetical protein [Actinorhabdospora filicis]GLZ78557.1 hypothetical protein Afil01_33640 [Actinorhabdospora filicis]
MGGVKYGPTQAEIKALAEKVKAAAIRVKGEKELLMIPLGSPDSAWAGQSSKDQTTGMTSGHQPKGKYGVYGVGKDDRYLGTKADWAALESAYWWIPGEFERYLRPEPRDFDAFVATAQKLTEGFVNVEKAPDPAGGLPPNTPAPLAKGTGAVDQPIRLTMGYTNDWSGHFADGFQAYLGEIPNISRRQALIADTLYQAIVAARDIYGAGRETLGDIARKTEIAIESIEAGKTGGGCSDDALNIAFGLIAGAATIAAGVATVGSGGLLGGPSAVAAWTIIAGVSNAAWAGGAKLIADPHEIDLLASDVDGVLAKMTEALNKRKQTILDMEQAAAGKLSENSNVVRQNTLTAKDGSGTQRNAFFPARPGMLDMPTDLKNLKSPENGFTHPSAAV